MYVYITIYVTIHSYSHNPLSMYLGTVSHILLLDEETVSAQAIAILGKPTKL